MYIFFCILVVLSPFLFKRDNFFDNISLLFFPFHSQYSQMCHQHLECLVSARIVSIINVNILINTIGKCLHEIKIKSRRETQSTKMAKRTTERKKEQHHQHCRCSHTNIQKNVVRIQEDTQLNIRRRRFSALPFFACYYSKVVNENLRHLCIILNLNEKLHVQTKEATTIKNVAKNTQRKKNSELKLLNPVDLFNQSYNVIFLPAPPLVQIALHCHHKLVDGFVFGVLLC